MPESVSPVCIKSLKPSSAGGLFSSRKHLFSAKNVTPKRPKSSIILSLQIFKCFLNDQGEQGQPCFTLLSSIAESIFLFRWELVNNLPGVQSGLRRGFTVQIFRANTHYISIIGLAKDLRTKFHTFGTSDHKTLVLSPSEQFEYLVMYSCSVEISFLG